MADDDNENPLNTFLYTGEGSIPWNVVRVEVDRSVTYIPERLFQHCWQLEFVLLHEGLLKIGKCAFRQLSSPRSILIPSTVTEIGEGAFYRCSNLETIELPQGLRSIGMLTFCRCSSLVEVKIPDLVTRIDHGAFMGCTNLVSVELREGLQMIRDQAFDGCSSLGRLCVPSSVHTIEKCAFDGCSSLSLVRLHEDLPKIMEGAFGGCPLESFRFFPLSDRMEAIRMDDETKSMFERRLREITLALSGEDRDDEDEDDSDDEGDAKAIRAKCKESLGRAHEVLTYLELKGASPVLELALWKMKIGGERGISVRGELVMGEDRGHDLSNEGRGRKRPKVIKNSGQDTQLSREGCRVKCGAGIVLPEVLKFFTFIPSWPQLELDDSEEENVDY